MRFWIKPALLFFLLLMLILSMLSFLRHEPSTAYLIAFKRVRYGVGGLYTMHADGKHVQFVAEVDNTTSANHRWSPDGRWLAYADLRDGRVYRVYLDGTQQKAITPTTNWNLAPEWSPKGDLIAVEARGTSITTLASLRPDGSEYHPFFEGLVFARTPQWSPDGSTIAFATNPQGSRTDIAIANLSTGQVSELTSTDHQIAPLFSPDGQWIAFNRIGHYGPSETWNIYLVRPNGTELHALTETSELTILQGWSPDSQWILATRFPSRVPFADIYKIHVATGETSVLVHSRTHDEAPRWSPDGQWVYFSSFRTGDIELYRIAPDGSQLEQLTDVRGEDIYPQPSPFLDWPWHGEKILAGTILGLIGILALIFKWTTEAR